MRPIIFVLLVLALLAAAGPIWLATLALASAVLPWVAFGLLAWVAYSILTGAPERHELRHEWHGRAAPPFRRAHPLPQRPAPRPDPPPRPPAPRPAPPARPELPIDVQVKVEQIRRKVEVLLGYASRFPPCSKDLYLVRQTASDYLPRTVEAYLALPSRDLDPLVAAEGNPALAELKSQLDLLDTKLDEIAQDLQRQDLDRLIANRRFLEERFGHPNA